MGSDAEVAGETKMRPGDPQKTDNAKQGFYVLAIGLGIGWLTGLSLAPVVAGVVTSLLAITAGLVAGLRTVRQATEEKQVRLSAAPAALLVVGIALAATAGNWARAHSILSPPAESTRQEGPSGAVADATVTGLHGVRLEDCDTLLGRLTSEDTVFRFEVRQAGGLFQELEASISETGELRAVVRAVCAQ